MITYTEENSAHLLELAKNNAPLDTPNLTDGDRHALGAMRSVYYSGQFEKFNLDDKSKIKVALYMANNQKELSVPTILEEAGVKNTPRLRG